MRQCIKYLTRLQSFKKRFKRVLVLLAVFALISTGMKMGGLFKNNKEELLPITIKKYEIFRYVREKFTVGSFLKKKNPGNMTYCNFRFGDSESFNYTDGDVAYTPELGDKSPYRVLYGVVRGFQFNTSETNTVTYTTHITLRYLFHVVEIATRWGGPISVACFVPGTDTVLALKILEKMCFCLKEMENVNINFIYHKNHPPVQTSLKNYSLWLDMEEEESPWRIFSTDAAQNSSSNIRVSRENKTSATGPSPSYVLSTSCYVPEKVFENSYRKKHGLVYPINVARNVARYGSRSKYILVSDIELLPSSNMVDEFLKMIQRLKERKKNLGDHYFTKKKHVFVVPVFEVSENEPDVPRTKSELLDLYSKERAVYFHRFVCVHCQRFPGIQKWLQKKVHPRLKPGIIQPLLVVKREFPYHRWEPVYIGTNEEPLYSELLTWEGQQDKMTQMHEMCLLDYRFVILNGAFLVHTPGIKRRRGSSSGVFSAQKSRSQNDNGTTDLNATNNVDSARVWLNSHMKRNSYLYQIITQDVMSRYHYNPRCRIH